MKRPIEYDFKFIAESYAPYALAIGQATLAWNHLQEHLAAVFLTTTKGDHVMAAAWYSQDYDRARRKMLEAAIQNRQATSFGLGPSEKYFEHFLFVLTETNKLEDARNNMTHAPLFFVDDRLAAQFSTETTGVVPADWYGNPRAAKLRRKNLLIEFRWLRDCAATLAVYTRLLDLSWRLGHPLPGRPKLPTREDQKSRQGPRRPPQTK
jgi:hypothetical protein